MIEPSALVIKLVRGVDERVRDEALRALDVPYRDPRSPRLPHSRSGTCKLSRPCTAVVRAAAASLIQANAPCWR